MNQQKIKLFQKAFNNSTIRSFHKPNKPHIEYHPAQVGVNFQPKEISQEEILKTIDPKAMVRKEPSYEYKDIPRDGEELNETHIMHFMQPFPDISNDIGKEYGFKIKGLEPTRFGDWERKGRCTDF
ncbi:UNKNOWN [Stylonychia lemnae]|uniref:Uncharacterized protein n=1 Tax=Stylonychia lemnae TaxID=5949 RepID=A0A078AND5_STYLE|nr:UNKNOWN [Stylonychia lemnae]|eukprot:CDW83684.1 UNKNOWN [Stylonychia lemnae]